MKAGRHYYAKSQVGQSKRRNAAAAAQRKQRDQPRSRRGVVPRNVCEPFAPPEDWHEPTDNGKPYQIIVQPPGDGYRHIVTPQQVRDRLAKLPAEFVRDLQVVQLSRMTRKKESFPCYGMQWGPALYLYPLESSLVEHFDGPPSPAVVNESKMFGGVWRQPEPGCWTLSWSEAAIQDFYLNNILIHELGHLLDDRNDSYTDRERYAEWFAIEYGYRPTGGSAGRRRKVKRRHHSK